MSYNYELLFIRSLLFYFAFTSTFFSVGHLTPANGGAKTGAFDEPLSEVCEKSYYALLRQPTCDRLFKFQSSCAQNVYAPVVSTALRLRCADELLEQLYAQMKEDLSKTEQDNTCASYTNFVDRYDQQFDLSQVPEMEKATKFRIKLCEEEKRKQEIASLENELSEVIRKNDCSTFEAFDRQKGQRLDADQTARLSEIKKTRCDTEKAITQALTSCLEHGESSGEFCRASTCFSDYQRAMARTGTAELANEMSKSEDICQKYKDMTACFGRDPCGGESCSFPLRLAIGTGSLLRHIEIYEKNAKVSCDANRDRERLARLEIEREQERERENAARQLRASRTTRLTLCNNSSKGTIFIAISYFDYDASDWIVEGWWSVRQGECNYIGDNFARGQTYFYAQTAKERYVWAGLVGLCINWGKFRRVNKGMRCSANRYRKFIEKTIDEEEYRQRFID